ncbi:hypothetical protein [Streptomyces sp. NL15-2K]|uniref:hypothetical protein n=1 Tax=Streptomyces sp. NL15-2K TaxID=376149 RepID=UPI000F57A350|nr:MULTISPECIES: hypothetical protein [Actinomycetes]WKX10265.1 hypothetical protein Q4V64_23265 [Kutzneria buriramensis]GCB48240.1 hypothetical protein SNL152K_5564 [Streptomyces sp. NL15-2K]
MGIESDQVVYEYLSRVGDVAQQRQLPSSTRMRLVSELRNEIDRRRAKAPVDSPAAVRRIIARLGSPHEVVDAAGGTGGSASQAPAASVPVQRAVDKDSDDDGGGRPKGLRRVVPRPRPAQAPRPEPSEGPSPPHLAGEDELGDTAAQPDWWRVDSSPFGVGDSVPGFVGGVEIPELLKPPPPKEPAKETSVEKPAPTLEKAEEAEAVVVEAPARRRRRFLPPLRGNGKGKGVVTGTRGRWSNPLLLLAAGLLVAGAILGNLVALLLGWGIAYLSRRLSDAETKLAVMILPGLSVAAGLLWLWGRTEGRWGTPIAEGQMNDAVAQTWPWVLRGAAVASALYLVWRSQKQR